MSEATGIRRGNRYTVYPNGHVYEGSKFKLLITNDHVLDYILDQSWFTRQKRVRLDNLIDGYPESFNFLSELNALLNEVAPIAVQEIREDINKENTDRMGESARLMALPIKKRIKELLQASKDG